MARFVVTRAPGPEWNPAKAMREQAAWEPHAAFMDALSDEGFVVYGGPAGDRNKVVLVFDAPSEPAIRARLALDPSSEAGVLSTVAVEPWAIWLGGDERIDMSHDHYLVAYGPGPDWDPTKERREQHGWDAHAEFMDALVDQGVVAVGGPLDERRALLVMQHDDEQTLRTLLDQDPWVNRVLAIERIEPWTFWLAPRPGRLAS